MSSPQRLVIEAAARLREADKRLVPALAALAAAMPGYPSATGGGRGGGRTITVDGERVPVTSVEALAFDLGRDDAVRARLALGDDLRVCCARLAELAAAQGRAELRAPGRPDGDTEFRRALRWAVVAADMVIRFQHQPPQASVGVAERLLAASTGVYGAVSAWSAPRMRPAAVERTVAPSEVWCSHCQAHGVMSPRRRDPDGRGHGTECRWCAEYRASAGHLPPGPLVRQHGEGRRITIADIRRHDPEHARRLNAGAA